ncbi:diguanylate cyclase domain-containing protein [Paracoccus sp. (in: a-proteobacteria)]|uniref:diguanylate cyclase n=1 Tax=Paracoccus sp. TaxID=267 RepID=UPI00396C8CA4
MTNKPVVLIVDDEATNIEIICAALEDEYEICFSLSAEQAVGLARAARPDLILLDVVMPEMDGYVLCRRFREDPDLADVPVIFTTAPGAPEAESHGLSLGAVDYMTKPFSLVALRQRVGNHIQLKHLRDQRAAQALRDPLTGLGNRRMLERQLPMEIRRLSRIHGMLSVIMLDIDHFKLLNDTYGHAEGNDCLRRIGTLLSDAMRRSGDLCLRHGGEEFVCILPGTDQDSAAWIGESIRSRIEAAAIPNIRSPLGQVVTVSVGIATGPCNATVIGEDWLTCAGQMLYRSQQAGGNRVSGQMLVDSLHQPKEGVHRTGDPYAAARLSGVA